MAPDTPGQPSTLGRRAQGKLLARQRLLDSAVALFAEHGYEHTTIDDIAHRAGLARATFFKHFQHKQDLLADWFDQRRDRVNRALDDEDAHRADTQDAATRLHAYLGTLTRISIAERTALAGVLTPWLGLSRPPAHDDCHLVERFAEVFAAGMTRGEFTPVVPAATAGRILCDLYLGALQRWCDAAEPHDDALAADLTAALAVILGGIGIPRQDG